MKYAKYAKYETFDDYVRAAREGRESGRFAVLYGGLSLIFETKRGQRLCEVGVDEFVSNAMVALGFRSKQGKNMSETKKAKYKKLETLLKNLNEGKLPEGRDVILTYAEPSGDVELYGCVTEETKEGRKTVRTHKRGTLLYTTDADTFQREALGRLGFTNVVVQEAGTEEEDSQEDADAAGA